MNNRNKGKVIFLNGPSSSGKSTLAYALQSKLHEPYLHIGIDKIIGMMPQHLNDWTGGQVDEGFWWKSAYDEHGNVLQHIQLGSYALKISLLLKSIATTILDSGINLIIDEVCVGEHSSMADWKKSLAQYKVVYVGVNASVEKLEEREKDRGDRILGSARAQWLEVHKNAIYDIELDTDKITLDDCVDMILKKVESDARS